MNTLRIVLLVAAILAAQAFILTASFDAPASSKRPAAAEAFESTPGYEKIDLRLREAWKERPSSKKALECILKARERLSEDDKAALAAAGFNSRTVVGTIATGNMAVRDVPDVSNLPFVQVMELAVPMSLKKK